MPRPTTFSVLSRLVAELQTTLVEEADDSLGEAEREILDLDLPLPETEDLVQRQMDLDRRFARLRYMTQALQQLGALESARNSFREERFQTRMANLRRVREGFDAVAGAQGTKPRDLALVVFEPESLSLGPGETVQGVTVRALGSSVRFGGMRVEQTERDTPGLVVRNDGCGQGGLLAPGDRCAVTLEWNGQGPVPNGVLVSEAVPASPGAPAMRQTHTFAFGPDPEMQVSAAETSAAEMAAAQTASLAGVVAEIAAAYDTLRSEVAQLTVGPTAGGPTTGEIEEIVGMQTTSRLEEMEARIADRIKALEPEPVDASTHDERSLPGRVHVATIQGAGYRAEAHIEVMPSQPGRFASSLLRVRRGDAIGEGWTVRAVQASRRRIVLAHPALGEAFAYARVFALPVAALSAPPIAAGQGQDESFAERYGLPPGVVLPPGFPGLPPGYGLPESAQSQ